MQKSVLIQLYNLNSQMSAKLDKMETRVGQLEHNNASLHTVPLSRAGVGAPPPTVEAEGLLNNGKVKLPHFKKLTNAKAPAKRPVAAAFNGEGTTMPGRTKYRKKLEMKTSTGTVVPTAGATLLTPMPSVCPPPSSMELD